MSIESADSADTILRHDTPITNQPPETVCDGCRELTARVERLEQQLLAKSGERAVVPTLGTTSCYWICIAAHSLCIFCLYTVSDLIQIGLMLTVGACGTMSVCHVFSTRTVPEKVLRTMLSCSVVVSSGVIGLALQDEDVIEMIPMVLVYLPFVLLGGWFVAKLFVWTRGWRIVPPGYPSEYPKLQIRHLMFCTFFVAAQLSLIRFLIDDISVIFNSEMFAAAAAVMFVVAISTVSSCVLARCILSNQRARFVRHLGLLMAAAFGLTIIGYVALLGMLGEPSFAAEMLLSVLIYAAVTVFGASLSSGFTFFMLRSAGYKLIHP